MVTPSAAVQYSTGRAQLPPSSARPQPIGSWQNKPFSQTAPERLPHASLGWPLGEHLPLARRHVMSSCSVDGSHSVTLSTTKLPPTVDRKMAPAQPSPSTWPR